ncbi:1768_t:CDS:2, partial [Ambispora leptoticha]
MAKYGYKRKEPISLENTTQIALEEERAIINKNIKSKRIHDIMQGESTSSFVSTNSYNSGSTLSLNEPEVIVINDSSETPPPPANHVSVLIQPPTLEIKSTSAISSSSTTSSSHIHNNNGIDGLEQAFSSSLAINNNNNVVTKSSVPPSTPTHQNVTVTKEGKKRIQPFFVRSLSSQPPTPVPPAFASSSQISTENKLYTTSSTTSNGSFSSQNHSVINGHSIQFESPSSILPSGGIPALIVGNKRKESSSLPQSSSLASSTTPETDGTPSKKHHSIATGKSKIDNTATTSMDTQLDSRVINSAYSAYISPMITMSQVRLAQPKVLNSLRKDIVGFSNRRLECQNYVDKKPSKLICSEADNILWVDFIPSKVLLLVGYARFSAAACDDGSLYAYSAAGKRLLPPIILETPASFLSGLDNYLLCLSQAGLLNVWDLIRRTAIISSVSIAPILQAATLTNTKFSQQTIVSATLRPNGIPMLKTTSGDVWIFHLEMKSWMRVYDPRYTSLRTQFNGSELPTVLSILEGNSIESDDEKSMIMEYLNPASSATKETLHKEALHEASQSFGQIENELISAEILNSRRDFRRNLALYAQQLADTGSISKAKELCEELWVSDIKEGDLSSSEPSIKAKNIKSQAFTRDSSHT